MKKIRLGTRPSALAMWQANWTRDALVALGIDVEIVKITTTGDVNRSEAIVNLGAQGVFTKEIQKALLLGEIDVAAHSLKDLPVETTPGLVLAAVPERGDYRDVFVSNRYASIQDLPPGAVVGTSSMRRQSMALRLCAKLWPGEAPWEIKSARGNVETRLRKLDEGEYDAVILASAGLTRLELNERARQYLERPDFLPAVGQGALGLETREDDAETREQVARLLHEPTYLAVTAERAFLGRLQGGCIAPIGALGTVVTAEGVGDALVLEAEALSFDGARSFSGQSLQVFPTGEGGAQLPLETKKALAELLGRSAAENLLDQGAKDLVDEIKRFREERALKRNS
ncbi:MAG: hydroxymethylbilane synthase [Thermoguttaceae bacterium]|nr:hydroxymethylbilane synthase [Thermoguttaceae bacterium]